MFEFLLSFFSKNSSYPYPSRKDYRIAYKRAWIDNIKDYTP